MQDILASFFFQGVYGAALAGTLIAFAATAAGAAVVLFPMHAALSRRIQPLTLGFAAGIMIAASVWSLLIPAIEMAEEQGTPGWMPAGVGFLLGVAFIALLDKILPHQHCDSSEPEGPRCGMQRPTLLVSAVTLHNIPEGMSLGLTFAVAALSGEPAALSGAFALAIGMAVQNIPEGAAVALPLQASGLTRPKAFAVGALSGIVEPIFGMATVALVAYIGPYMPWLLAFSAGAMMYVVVEELIPAAHLDSHSDIGTLSVMAGFVLMMLLDTALG